MDNIKAINLSRCIIYRYMYALVNYLVASSQIDDDITIEFVLYKS